MNWQSIKEIFSPKAYRARIEQREAQWWAAREELDRNTDREEKLTAILTCESALFSEEYVNSVPERIFAIRDERVAILRRLGWDVAAEKLEADTGWRREWTAAHPFRAVSSES